MRSEWTFDQLTLSSYLCSLMEVKMRSEWTFDQLTLSTHLCSLMELKMRLFLKRYELV